MKTWYSANLFFEGVHDARTELPSLWQEIVVLISADDERSARQQADAIGKDKEHSYTVSDPTRHQLAWRFIQSDEIFEIAEDSVGHGTEVFSRFMRAAKVRAILEPFEP